MASECGVRVVCRFRPLNGREKQKGNHSSFLDFVGHTGVTVRAGNKEDPYQFDHIFGGEEAVLASQGKEGHACTQDQVWSEVGSKEVIEVTKGFMATIFAYGQTGAGKSFSMLGPDCTSKDRGIIPRACQALFEYIEKDKEGTEFQVKCSFLEIYKEVIRDLLSPGGSSLRVRETPQRGVWVDGLTERFVGSMAEVMELLQTGEKFRACAFTQMNATSSRSHSVFTITLIQKSQDGSEKIGKLNLADLAGSEKVGKTGATGDTLKEAMKINQSLSALGNCINALSKSKGKGHIPYRDSKLTHVLKESLGGNSKTTLLMACSPHISNLDEILSTLRFGKRAKTIKNKVTARVHRSVEELNNIILQLRKEVSFLRKHNRLLEQQLSSLDPSLDLGILKNSVRGSVLLPSAPLGDVDSVPNEEMEDEDDDYNPVEVVELQIRFDKAKEESSFAMSRLEEQLQATSEVLDEKENLIVLVRQELVDAKQLLKEKQLLFETSKQADTEHLQGVEKQLYELSLDMEKLKVKLAMPASENDLNRLKSENTSLLSKLEMMEAKIKDLESKQEPNTQSQSIGAPLSSEIETKDSDSTLTFRLKELEGQVAKQQKELETRQREIDEKSSNSAGSIDYEKEMKMARLEIEIEGQQRLCAIQESRCQQLQSVVDEQNTQLHKVREESEATKNQFSTQEDHIIKLTRQVELYQEAERLGRELPTVRVVQPISQTRSLSSIIGQRKMRENLPKRYSMVPVKEGYMVKQGGIFRNWKKRWFVLRENPPLLYYFESEGAVDPKGCIPLDECVLKLADIETKRPNTIGIYHETLRTFFLQTSSPSELSEWRSAIEDLLRRA